VSYRGQRPHRGPDRKRGAKYQAGVDQLRAQVQHGRGCWFYGRPGYGDCPGAIDLALHHNHRWAFTAHHLDRLMDGGLAVPGAHRMAPAHRACNARDGLIAQNTRRHTRSGHTRQVVPRWSERTSRAW
jgi:hypothetical protein